MMRSRISSFGFAALFAAFGLFSVSCESGGDTIAGISAEQVTEMLSADFSVDSLKGMLDGLGGEQVSAIAGKFSEAIGAETDVLAGLKDKIAGAAAGTGIDVEALKTKVTESTDLLASLKDKLGVVVDKLNELGIDASQFTSLLG